MRLTAAIVCLLLLAFSVAGCGSGAESANSTSAAIAKAAFVRKADAICAITKQKVLAGFRKVSNEQVEHFQAAKIAMMAEVAIPALEAQVEEIRALGAPAGDADRVDAILEATQEAIDEGPQKLARSYTFYGKTAKLATEYGLTACAFE